jgi:hypothetical protein
MRFKFCVATLFLVAAIGVVVLTSPAMAAEAGDSVSVAGPGGYVITYQKLPTKTLSAESSIASIGVVSMLAEANTITQGQYKWHYRDVYYYTTSLNFYLYWGNPSNSLRLRIFTPDQCVLGPFYDPFDGTYNGAVGVTVSRDGGVAQGTWIMEVYGDRVSGTQSYTMSN